MGRGNRKTWTQKDLEEVMTLAGSEAHAEFARRHDIATSSVYSLRRRVRTVGIEQILYDQDHRYQGDRFSGGRGLRTRETERLKYKPKANLADQLRTPRKIAIGRSGAGEQAQYTVTIPKTIAEKFVEEFGRDVYFRPSRDGIEIIPADGENKFKKHWLTEEKEEKE